MAQEKERSPGWADCKRALREISSDELMRLVQDLYRFSDENRAFLQARLLPEQSDQSLKHAADKLKKMLSYSSIVNSRFRHRDVKRLIDQFAKASGDHVGVAELLLTDIAESLKRLEQLGDVEELVDHSFIMMDRLEKVLPEVPRSERQPLVDCLIVLAQKYGRSFGYGLSDELKDMASNWKKRMGEGPLEAV